MTGNARSSESVWGTKMISQPLLLKMLSLPEEGWLRVLKI